MNPETREVLSESTYTRAPVDAAVAGDHPSPGIFLSSIPKSEQRWVTKRSSSTKLLGSKKVESFPGAELAGPVLGLDARASPPPFFRFGLFLF